jgi:hypothetical protein
MRLSSSTVPRNGTLPTNNFTVETPVDGGALSKDLKLSDKFRGSA